jgi:hypothetical protein
MPDEGGAGMTDQEQRVKCPEDPRLLLGAPLGQYHCPDCGCMQIAGCDHFCDSDACLLENCECLPDGSTKSPNLLAWEAQPDDR